jgi:hypothetical protein
MWLVYAFVDREAQMQIFHRIAHRIGKTDKKILDEFGLEAQPIGSIGVYYIEDNDVRWPRISEWAKERRAVVLTETRFSPDENEAAEWFEISINSHQGYPQPESGYIEQTYDLSDSCPTCLAGRVQNMPFRIKGEPKWGRRGVMQLNWVFDEFFVQPAVWDAIFKPFGVDCRPVLSRSGKQLQQVVQLIADPVVDIQPIDTPMICEFCQHASYPPHTRGFFPKLEVIPTIHFVKTRQRFGYETPWHATLVSKALRQALTDHGVLGLKYWPVARSEI